MERPLNATQNEMLALERFFPHHLREQAERLLFALSIFFLSFSVLFNILIDTRAARLWPIAEGLFLISFALLLKTILIEVYFHYLRLRLEEHHEISFGTLLVIGFHHPQKKDLAKAFVHSHLGREVMLRLGIAKETIHHFLHHKEHVDLPVPSKGFFPDLASYIYDEDPYFRDFLERIFVSKDLLLKSSEMTEKKHHRHLASRPLLSIAFQKDETPIFSMEHVTRTEIEELEHFYRIIITEQAIQLIVQFFKDDMIRYISENTRMAVLTELIESCPSVILPADVRHFLIHKKATQ